MKLLIIAQKVDVDDDVLGFFHGWVQSIAMNCESVRVVCLSKGRIDLPSNTKVYSLGKEHRRNKFFQGFLFYLYTLWFLPKSDGVFVHMAPEYVKALYPVNFFFKKPVILWYAHIKVSPTAQWAISKIEKVLTPSKESFNYASEKIISTGHGIDVKKFSPLDIKKTSPPIILAQSRISRVKRLHVLIEAISELRNIHSGPFECHVIGDTIYPDDVVYLGELKTLIAQKKLESIVKWIGPVRNIAMPKFYNEAVVFVRLQGGGGFGKTELESMACGTPAITPTPVYKNVLGRFADNLFFPEDDAKQCAQRIHEVLGWSSGDYEACSVHIRDIVVKNHNLENLSKTIVNSF
jgi:glycosyltransferase involved in cell wall biosynthesis